jgi:two-component system sensor histidine kinase DctS
LRWSLWSLLIVLVGALLVTLVWLAGRYEASQVQSKLERDTADAVVDVRNGLTRNVQTLQALHTGSPGPGAWEPEAAALLREHREWLRLEWRDAALGVRAAVDSPFRPPVFTRLGRPTPGRRSAGLQQCPPHQRTGLFHQLFRAADGRPRRGGHGAVHAAGHCRRAGGLSGGHLFAPGDPVRSGQQAGIAQPGGVFHRSRRHPPGPAWHGPAWHPDLYRPAAGGPAGQHAGAAHRQLARRPDLFPNVLTALVTAMSIALVSVLVLLGKDMRRRLRAEHDLADALAFRKAMEDSLVTGLRARDLQGRITYVNPAFCQMVGFSSEELLGHSSPRALLAPGAGRRIPAAPGRAPGRSARAAAGGV